MPFGPLRQPSIGLSLIRAALPPTVSSRIEYFTVRFGEIIGTKLYEELEGFTEIALLGDWLFTPVAFDAGEAPVGDYFDEIIEKCAIYLDRDARSRARFKHDVLRARERVPAFLDACVADVLEIAPRILGFTSTFQQSVASIALARRIKAAAPDTLIVIGGANCEGAMGAELVRQFDCLDVAVSGEGELVFPQIVGSWLAERRLRTDLEGVLARERVQPGHAPIRNTTSVEHLDLLPIPDFTDFLAQWEASTLSPQAGPVLLYETSRGCWWGERSHCTFCGLNGGNMAYRSKSAPRALSEFVALVELSKAHGVAMIATVDNILDMKYFQDFIPALAAVKTDFEIFYEVKANLRREQVKALAAAGITRLQPGIETLSTPISKLMKKGVRALQSIQLLKFCKESAVTTEWNVLCGFPGEEPSEYARCAAMVPALVHLRPPSRVGPIRLARFSPNFDHAEEMGFTDVAPYPAYRYVYRGVSDEALHGIAYFFEYNYREERHPEVYTAELSAMIEHWKAEHPASDLLWIDENERIRLIDTRPMAPTPVAELRGLARFVLLFCDTMRLYDDIKKHASAALPQTTITDALLESTLAALQESGYVMREDNLYLTLAIEYGTYAIPRESVERFKRRMAELTGAPRARLEPVPA